MKNIKNIFCTNFKYWFWIYFYIIIFGITCFTLILQFTINIDNTYRPNFLKNGVEIGHRGYPLTARDNSLMGLYEAKRHNLTIVECDLYITKDNVIVVSHDHKVKNGGHIKDYTFKELNKYSYKQDSVVVTLEKAKLTQNDKITEESLNKKNSIIKKNNKLIHNKNVEEKKIVNFDEFIKVAKKLNLKLDLDLKNVPLVKTFIFVQNIHKILEKYDYQSNIIVSSFYLHISYAWRSMYNTYFIFLFEIDYVYNEYIDKLNSSDTNSIYIDILKLLNTFYNYTIYYIANALHVNAIGFNIVENIEEYLNKYSEQDLLFWTSNNKIEKTIVKNILDSNQYNNGDNKEKLIYSISDCPNKYCKRIINNY